MWQGDTGSINAHRRDAMLPHSNSYQYDDVNCERPHVHLCSESSPGLARQALPKANGQPESVEMAGRELLCRTTVHESRLHQYLVTSLSMRAKGYETEVQDIVQQICQVVAHVDTKNELYSLDQAELHVQVMKKTEATDRIWEVVLFGRVRDATEDACAAFPSSHQSTQTQQHDIGRACTLTKGSSRVQPPHAADRGTSLAHNESICERLIAGPTKAMAAFNRRYWGDYEHKNNGWLVDAEPRVNVLEHKSSYCATVQQRNMPRYLGIALVMLAEIDDAEAQGTVGHIIHSVSMLSGQTSKEGRITEAVAELHVQTGFRWQSKPYSLGGVELAVHLTLLEPAQNVDDHLWEVRVFVFSREESKVECIAQPLNHPTLAVGDNEMSIHEHDDSSAIRPAPIELFF